ncbi:MAG: serine/threonine protein kinase, partial [Chloroflexi bacterium]|nr:serine/threonine protein kinase [Chloroflexota bacterium]
MRREEQTRSGYRRTRHMDVEKIGRYEVRSELGRGGMSTVYCAFDPQMSREVALKVLPRELLHDPQFRARFEREARTIAMLEHPAIVPIYDFGEEDGQPYFTMRYMTGGSLSERLKKGKLTLQEAARIFDRLAPALDEAHEKNIIHRDLKPGNILFDRLGDPYVSDFGIAKIAESPASYTGSSIIGTPAYMSPEQAQGESLDSRSDIYGMGVILFEMLSGRQPYEADTPMGVAVKHITDPVPRLLDANPDLPPAIEPVIQKALAKRKDDRFSNAAELAVALGAVARGESPDLKTSASATRLAQPGTRKSGRKAPEQAATVLRPARRKRGLSCLIIPLLAVVLLGGGTAALYFTGVLDDVIALVTGWISGTPPA